MSLTGNEYSSLSLYLIFASRIKINGEFHAIKGYPNERMTRKNGGNEFNEFFSNITFDIGKARGRAMLSRN